MCNAIRLAHGTRLDALRSGLEADFRAAVGIQVDVVALFAEHNGGERGNGGAE